jgi:malonyl-CoA/methylmalonyl-CoA synthetase
MLIYTSGTTGKSKGVELSFRALVSNMAALTGAWGWTEADRLLLSLPLFHVHGLGIGIHGGLLSGVTVLLEPRFSPERVVEGFARAGATVFMGVPTMYRMLLDHLEAHPDDAEPLRRGRLFTAGSAALPAADLRRFEALTGHRILERYGMSETLITLSNPLFGDRRAGSVGMPVPGCEVRIVGEDGAECAPGEAGELRVRGTSLMSGYWRNAAATASAFDGDWFCTGDVGHRDEDGYVHIVGRKSTDIIKSGGFKISAREIEEVLASHPAVVEVAVFGVADPRWGQAIAAAVVPGEATDPDRLETRLAEHVAGELADYKKPRHVFVIDALPRNALGKVQKKALIDRFGDGA